MRADRTERKSVWLNTLRGIKAVKSVYCRVFTPVVRKESLTKRKMQFWWKLVEHVHIDKSWSHTNVHFWLRVFERKICFIKKMHNNQNIFPPRLCNLNIAINAWRGKCKTCIDWNTLLCQHIQKEYTKRYKPRVTWWFCLFSEVYHWLGKSRMQNRSFEDVNKDMFLKTNCELFILCMI